VFVESVGEVLILNSC